MRCKDFRKNIKGFVAVCCILSVLATFCSCGANSSKGSAKDKQQSGETKQENEKIPDTLKNIESSIESIFIALNLPAIEDEDKKTHGMESKPKQEGEPQQGDKQQQNEEEQNKDQGGEQQQDKQQKDENQQEEKKQQEDQQQGGQQQDNQQLEDIWKEIDTEINKLHYLWNSFMPEITKKGANISIIDTFGDSLNTLTKTIVIRDKTKTMFDANSLYSNLIDIFSLYKTKMSPEVKRLRYYTRNAILNSYISDWANAEKDISDARSSWSILKTTLEEEKAEESGKLELSLYEMEKVVADKNKVLADIKGRIALSNIQAFEKSFDKK